LFVSVYWQARRGRRCLHRHGRAFWKETPTPEATLNTRPFLTCAVVINTS
jgi:hypothetical protein